MARRGNSLLYAAGLFLSDFGAILAAFLLTFALRFHYHQVVPFVPDPLEIPPLARYAKTLPLVLFVMILSFRSGGLYRESLAFVKVVRIGSILKQVFLGIFTLIALSAFYREFTFSRTFGLMLIPSFTVLVSLFRKMLIKLENHIRFKQGKTTRVLIVGEGMAVTKLSNQFSQKGFEGYELIGVVGVPGENYDDLPNPLLGDIHAVTTILDQQSPDQVILASNRLEHTIVAELITSCDKRMIQFYIVPDLFNLLTSRVELTTLGGINVLGLEKFPLDNGLNRAGKRILDIFGSLFGLLVSSPILLLSAIGIKLSSTGPVFFHQVRCREDGLEFTMYKFRTMDENAEKESGPVWAAKGDGRCTRIGSLLRVTNIDELPQLLNVLQGHMSLVGPRPERPHFIEKFKSDIPRYMSRHHIKPGMTGWAQVNGLRGNTSLDERIKYDLYYIENWSVWFDLKIIFLTFFSYKNAY